MSAAASDAVGRPSGPSRSFLALAGAVALVAVGGGVLGVRALTSSPQTADQPAAVKASFGAKHQIHEDVLTSFGVIAVEILEKNAGVSAKAIASSTHFPSYVGPGQLQVQATINMRNALARPVTLNAGQFVVAAGAKRYAHSHATVERVQLQPDALLDQIVTFTVPRKGEPLVLEFADPASKSPIRIDLGRATARVTDPGGTAHPGH